MLAQVPPAGSAGASQGEECCFLFEELRKFRNDVQNVYMPCPPLQAPESKYAVDHDLAVVVSCVGRAPGVTETPELELRSAQPRGQAVALYMSSLLTPEFWFSFDQ